ncbi:hypothetical protein D3C87_2092620 [compost metagenome]
MFVFFTATTRAQIIAANLRLNRNRLLLRFNMIFGIVIILISSIGFTAAIDFLAVIKQLFKICILLRDLLYMLLWLFLNRYAGTE